MSRLFAVVVGCNYTDSPRPSVPPLHAAEDDAKQFSAFLASAPLVDGQLSMLELLLGSQATNPRIQQAVQEAFNYQSPDDTMLFYFSGHGLRTDDGLTIYTWDSDIHARDLLAEFNRASGPVRVVLDCCDAGAITPYPPAAPVQPAS